MRINNAGPTSDSFEGEYDYLVLSSPLTLKTLQPFLDLRENEKAMFNSGKVKYNTFGIVLLNDTSKVKFDWRVFHIFPLATINHPAIFAHQFPENPAFEIYTPMTTIDDESHESLRNRIINIESQSISVIKNIGGNSSEEDVLHYDIWKYFYHVSLEDFKAGYFDELEKKQG